MIETETASAVGSSEVLGDLRCALMCASKCNDGLSVVNRNARRKPLAKMLNHERGNLCFLVECPSVLLLPLDSVRTVNVSEDCSSASPAPKGDDASILDIINETNATLRT